ncbi:MAG: translation elongation factor Ts [Lactobacillales bacterium]|jgi:elongation factor Ts|nr:translation elongation factor Ts [Lactobacillales bacterium]
MAEITAGLVKELREKTCAGMMDCKKALAETNGNLEEAVDYLRKKGLSVAEKKSGRVANQGLVGVGVKGNMGILVEVNSETDFVARNTDFQKFVTDVVDLALAKETLEDIQAVKTADLNGKSVEATLTDLIAKIGENMNLRQIAFVKLKSNGVVVPYMHTAAAPNLGKIGVLVGLDSDADKAALSELGKKIAMHIAAASPRFLRIEDVDSETLAREKAIYEEQAKSSGKPANIIEKMVEGRLRKFYEEVVLLEQSFVMNPDQKIKDVIADASKQLGKPVELSGFMRFNLGEGIEKKEEDFAAEVNKQLGK